MLEQINIDKQNQDNSKVLVIQVGARRRYAVPRMIEDADMLTALYTDSSSHSALGRVANYCGHNAPEKIQRLARRKITNVPTSKIFSTDYPLMKSFITRFLNGRDRGIKTHVQYGDWLSEKMIKKGIDGADIIYSMNCSCLNFVKYAKREGCKSVIDVFMHPHTHRILHEENEKYPKWEQGPSQNDIELMHGLWREAIRIADILLCPSEWVAEGVLGIDPAVASKIRIVPYGSSIDYGGRINSPVKGRVFFSGGNALIKGLPYLAQAAMSLLKYMPGLDVRVAGEMPAGVVSNPLCNSLNFLGKLTTEQMKEEFLSADLFVLPSLSEGLAGVVVEAIAAACPVVVTRESGCPIVHGREGLIVEARNVDALVVALKTVIGDRQLRSNMSKACLDQLPYYSEFSWKKRLIDAIVL